MEEKTPEVIPEPPKEEVVEAAPLIVEEPVPEKLRHYSDAPLLTLCNVASCCGDRRFVYRAQTGANNHVLMPLRQVYIQTEISGATYWTSVDLYYHNPSRDTVLCNSSFTFPVDQGKNTSPTLTQFEAIIDDDTTVKTEVRRADGSVSNEPYELRDAANRPKVIEFRLGDIQPGQPVKISFQMIGLLEVVNGHLSMVTGGNPSI